MRKRFVLIPIITSLALAGIAVKIPSAEEMEVFGSLRLISGPN